MPRSSRSSTGRVIEFLLAILAMLAIYAFLTTPEALRAVTDLFVSGFLPDR